MSDFNGKERIGREPMLDMFVFESQQLIEQLEQAILRSESSGEFETSVHEIFRIMHTIKGNSAMLLFNNIAVVVKPLPGYIKKINGIAGCTLMGEGNISLIIDTFGLIA